VDSSEKKKRKIAKYPLIKKRIHHLANRRREVK